MGKHVSIGNVSGGAIGEVWRLLKQGIDIPAAWHAPLVEELRDLTCGHMAVLMHKRAKFGADDSRWHDELQHFVGHTLWPHIAGSEVLAGRNEAQVAELLDEVVVASQRREAEREVDIPLTSRFDTSWAS